MELNQVLKYYEIYNPIDILSIKQVQLYRLFTEDQRAKIKELSQKFKQDLE